MDYEYRILYKPPLEEIEDDNPDAWRKVWYYTIEDCPEKLDLKIQILKLIRVYNLNQKYIIVQRADKKDKTKYITITGFDK